MSLYNNPSGRGSRLKTLLGGSLAVGFAALIGPLGTSVTQEADLQGTRDAYAAWLETELLISEETRDWRLSEDERMESIRLIERELATLVKQTEETEAAIAESDARRATMTAELDAQEAGVASLAERIPAFEQRLRELLPRLPFPLRKSQALGLLEPRLPEAGAETEIPLSQRYLTVVGILNEVDKFQRDLHVVSQRHTLGNGQQVSAETLYLGMSLAFYVTADGEHAGRGFPGADGWTWVVADESADQIADAIAVRKGDLPASFLSLPVDIR